MHEKYVKLTIKQHQLLRNTLFPVQAPPPPSSAGLRAPQGCSDRKEGIVLVALAVGQVLHVHNWTTVAVITYDDYNKNSRFRDSFSVLTMNGIIGQIFSLFIFC